MLVFRYVCINIKSWSCVCDTKRALVNYAFFRESTITVIVHPNACLLLVVLNWIHLWLYFIQVSSKTISWFPLSQSLTKRKDRKYKTISAWLSSYYIKTNSWSPSQVWDKNFSWSPDALKSYVKCIWIETCINWVFQCSITYIWFASFKFHGNNAFSTTLIFLPML